MEAGNKLRKSLENLSMEPDKNPVFQNESLPESVQVLRQGPAPANKTNAQLKSNIVEALDVLIQPAVVESKADMKEMDLKQLEK